MPLFLALKATKRTNLNNFWDGNPIKIYKVLSNDTMSSEVANKVAISLNKKI